MQSGRSWSLERSNLDPVQLYGTNWPLWRPLFPPTSPYYTGCRTNLVNMHLVWYFTITFFMRSWVTNDFQSKYIQASINSETYSTKLWVKSLRFYLTEPILSMFTYPALYIWPLVFFLKITWIVVWKRDTLSIKRSLY